MGTAGSGVGSRLAGQVGRHALTYAGSSFMTLGLSLISLAVLTRFLAPAEFGKLALLLIFASFVTVACNLGTLQGAAREAYGASGEGDADDAEPGDTARDRRSALTTGLLLTLAVTALATVGIAIIAAPLARVVTGDAGDADLVTLAAASGGLGSVWRFAIRVPYLERRPGLYAVLNATRPVLSIAIAIPLVASGEGVAGALLGIAIGTAAATLLALLSTRHSYGLPLERGDSRKILKAGGVFVPVVAAFWVVQNVDLYLLSQFAPDAEVGEYRVASRVGAMASFFGTALLMAWTPLVRTPAFAAIERERGEAAIGGAVATYAALFAVGLILALAVMADTLATIAPSSYADAAGLIPLTGLGFASYALFVVLYRAARFRHKQRMYIWLAVVAAAVFATSALLLIPAIGAEGAALAVTIGFVPAIAGLMWLSQRGPQPLPIDVWRIGTGIALGVACYGAARAAEDLVAVPVWLAETAALIAFPLLALALGIVPRESLRGLKLAATAAVARRPPPTGLRERLGALPDDERELLEKLVRRSLSVEELACERGVPARDVLASAVGILRRLGGAGAPSTGDAAIGSYLFTTNGTAAKDRSAKELWANGAEPLDVEELEAQIATLRRVPPSMWTKAPAETLEAASGVV